MTHCVIKKIISLFVCVLHWEWKGGGMFVRVLRWGLCVEGWGMFVCVLHCGWGVCQLCVCIALGVVWGGGSKVGKGVTSIQYLYYHQVLCWCIIQSYLTTNSTNIFSCCRKKKISGYFKSNLIMKNSDNL